MKGMVQKYCSRCGGLFECGRHSVCGCACAGFDIPQALREQMARDYTDCLCTNCLDVLTRQFRPGIDNNGENQAVPIGTV